LESPVRNRCADPWTRLVLTQVLQDIQRMAKAAQDLCDRTKAAGAFMPGCPVKTPVQ
jgi:hypothetical protein